MNSKQEPEDIKVDKYRISGFWDTPLDSILRNLGVRSMLFAGVNTDQCVLHSLTDANFLGYGCILVEDCCATTSPDFCTEATVWNVKKCFGFVTDSEIGDRLARQARGAINWRWQLRLDAQSGRADFGAFVPGPRCACAPTASGSLDGLTFAVKDLIDVAGTRDRRRQSRLAEGAMPGGDDRRRRWQRCLRPAPRWSARPSPTNSPSASKASTRITARRSIRPARIGFPAARRADRRVAVAAGLVDFALGTDTGGSVRVPASFVGVCGFRPTHDAVSLAGVMPFAPSYDTVGWFARDAATLACVGDVLLPKAEVAVPIRTLSAGARCVRAGRSRVSRRLAAVALRGVRHVRRDHAVRRRPEQQWLECYRVVQGAEIWATARARGSARQNPASATRSRRVLPMPRRSRRPTSPAGPPVRVSIAARVRAMLGDGIGLVDPDRRPASRFARMRRQPSSRDFYQRR